MASAKEYRLARRAAKRGKHAARMARQAGLGYGDDSAEIVRRNADLFGLKGAGKERPATFGHTRGVRLNPATGEPRALQDSTATGRQRPERKPHAVWFAGGKWAK